jgi:23S rRNA A1618 N6-methylase RlmF
VSLCVSQRRSSVGTDIDEKAIENCSTIIEANPKLVDFISLQQQTEARFILKIYYLKINLHSPSATRLS